MLEDLAQIIRKDPVSRTCIQERRLYDSSPEVWQGPAQFLDQFGDMAWEKDRLGQDPSRLLSFIIAMPERFQDGNSSKAGDPGELEKAFLYRFEEDQRSYASKLLDLARASYRLRDDDNIYMGKIKG
jgi:pyruvate,water dikinase